MTPTFRSSSRSSHLYGLGMVITKPTHPTQFSLNSIPLPCISDDRVPEFIKGFKQVGKQLFSLPGPDSFVHVHHRAPTCHNDSIRSSATRAQCAVSPSTLTWLIT